MGAYDSHHTGSITITPPLTWAQIKNNHSRGLQDLRLLTEETVEDTPTGCVTVITGTAIVPLTTEAYSGYEVREELQSMIDAFPRNDFRGEITARPEDPHGDPWRYTIRGRRVIRQVPQGRGGPVSIEPGQVYRSCDPRGGPLIRVVTVNPNSVDVVDAQDGKRPRRILDKFLHDSPITKTGKLRRTGYALEAK